MPRFKYFLLVIGLLQLLGFASSSFAGMRWSARAIDPSLIAAISSDSRLLREKLFGVQPKILTDKLNKGELVDLSDKQLRDELEAWAAKRKAEVGDTEIDLDKAWHGIHYLLTGSSEPNSTLASKVIMGGEDIGPDLGYGPAQLLKPDDVKAIAKLLEETSPDVLQKRFEPKEMTRVGIYPAVIWEREGNDALRYVLDYYEKLVAFYRLAAERGQAVIFAIS
jgi:Domain of unknown function (DUF1877)